MILIASLCIAGAVSAGACSGPPSRDGVAPQLPAKAATLVPNIDDDNADGIPDVKAAPLAAGADDEMLQVRVASPVGLPGGAVVRAEIAEPWARFARAFVRADSPAGPRFVESPARVDPAGIRENGVVIGVEAADFAARERPPAMEVSVTFETGEGRPLGKGTIRCTVAPFLISSCLDPAERVQVVGTKLTEAFVRDLEPLVASAGAGLEIVSGPSIPEHDIWIQDAVEIGTASDGDHFMHVALHGNRGRELDDVFAKKALGRDSGVIRRGDFRGKPAQWIDWYGNLEVSPPLQASGRDFPHGRFYAGTQGERSMHPEVIEFLEVQGAQGPVLWLDTSWLMIGHVDETVSWVPSRVGTPYRMMIPSPRLAVEILKQAEKDAPGAILNRGTKRADDRPGDELERPVARALADEDLMAAQARVQEKIDAVRRTLQVELGVADADVVEIPVLFNSSDDRYRGRYFAETVNMVNGLLVGNVYICPDPRGPLVGGRDVLLQAVKDRLEPLGCRVVPLDCFYPYHRWGGEIHCGTNAARRPRQASPFPADPGNPAVRASSPIRIP